MKLVPIIPDACMHDYFNLNCGIQIVVLDVMHVHAIVRICFLGIYVTRDIKCNRTIRRNIIHF